MKENCKNCKKFFECCCNFKNSHGIGCIEFQSVKKHDYVLIHFRKESGFYSIVCFSNDFKELFDMRNTLPECGKKNHDFFIVSNLPNTRVTEYVNIIKDYSLLNICKNVAYALSRAEYSMLKKKYSRSKFCFDRAKSMIADACNILDNY